MPTAEELTLAIRSEGVGKTQDELEGVESAMDETAKSAGDSAEELSGFSEKFEGAMSAAVTALAVGAAGLLSQVPVLGEAFAGLGAIVSALAFQMDGVLRPVVSPLTELFYGISAAIFEADGIVGKLIGGITALVAIAAVVIPAIAAIGATLGVWASTAAGVVAILSSLWAGIVALGAAIAGLISLPALLIAAIVAFATAYALNLGGVRDKTNSILADIWNYFAGLGEDLLEWGSNVLDDVYQYFADLGSDLAEWASGLAEDAYQWGVDLLAGIIDGLESLIDDVVDGFTSVASGLAQWASDLASAAYEWGVGIIEGIIDGVMKMAQRLADALVTVFNGVVDKINDILDNLPSEVTSKIGFESIDKLDSISIDDTASRAASTDFSGVAADLNGAFQRGDKQNGGTTIDGRQITESTGRYRSDPARRQGL